MNRMDYIPERQPLSPEEAEKPYAKYYYRALTLPQPEILAKIDHKINPDKALPLDMLNDVFNADTCYDDIGYCVMPDGSGYAASRVFLEGCTSEMMDWWCWWHPSEDLRYKLWYYPSHTHCRLVTRGAGWETTSLSRDIGGGSGYGNVVSLVEDVGLGPERITLRFLSAEDFGLDTSRIIPGEIAVVSGASGRSCALNAPKDTPMAPAVVSHIGKKVDGGLELISHFWIGWTIENGKARLEVPAGVRVPDFVPQNLLNHCIREFTNLGAFLPDIYSEFKDSI